MSSLWAFSGTEQPLQRMMDLSVIDGFCNVLKVH